MVDAVPSEGTSLGVLNPGICRLAWLGRAWLTGCRTKDFDASSYEDSDVLIFCTFSVPVGYSVQQFKMKNFEWCVCDSDVDASASRTRTAGMIGDTT
jgi:hypothetical protein